MNAAIAARVGRPDLGATGGFGVASQAIGGTDAQGSYMAGIVSEPASAGAVLNGRISAGMIGAITVGLLLFYVWTRAYQA